MNFRKDNMEPDVVALLNAYGYSVEHTGGGCTAWFKYFGPNQSRAWVMLTSLIDPSHECGEACWLVGVYDEAASEGYVALEPSASYQGDRDLALGSGHATARFVTLKEALDFVRDRVHPIITSTYENLAASGLPFDPTAYNGPLMQIRAAMLVALVNSVPKIADGYLFTIVADDLVAETDAKTVGIYWMHLRADGYEGDSLGPFENALDAMRAGAAYREAAK